MTRKDEPHKPMAIPDADLQDQIDALKIRVAELEKQVEDHRRYHFGRQP